MKFEELVNQSYDSLSYNEKIVVEHILRNKQDVEKYTSEDISQQCGVTRPTLLRTLKKLNIASFAELKYLLKQEDNIEVEDIMKDDIFNHYSQMMDDILKKDYRDICEILHHARYIYVYGTGNEQKSIAEELKRMLFSLGQGVTDFYDQGEVEFQKDIFSEEDVFIVISLSGETTKAIEILKSIKHTNIQLLSITKLKNNTVARMCDYNLYVGTKTIPLKQKDGYEIMTSFYVLLDCLFVEYLQLLKEDKV